MSSSSRLGFLVSGVHFLLYLGRGLFEFRRELDVAVVLHAGAGRDETTDDDVFLQAAQIVDGAVDGRLGEDAGGLLEDAAEMNDRSRATPW